MSWLGRTKEIVQVGICIELVNLTPRDVAFAYDVLNRLARPHGVGSVGAGPDALQNLLVTCRQLAGWEDDGLALHEALWLHIVIDFDQLLEGKVWQCRHKRQSVADNG